MEYYDYKSVWIDSACVHRPWGRSRPPLCWFSSYNGEIVPIFGPLRGQLLKIEDSKLIQEVARGCF